MDAETLAQESRPTWGARNLGLQAFAACAGGAPSARQRREPRSSRAAQETPTHPTLVHRSHPGSARGPRGRGSARFSALGWPGRRRCEGQVPPPPQPRQGHGEQFPTLPRICKKKKVKVFTFLVGGFVCAVLKVGTQSKTFYLRMPLHTRPCKVFLLQGALGRKKKKPACFLHGQGVE